MEQLVSIATVGGHSITFDGNELPNLTVRKIVYNKQVLCPNY